MILGTSVSFVSLKEGIQGCIQTAGKVLALLALLSSLLLTRLADAYSFRKSDGPPLNLHNAL